MGLCVLCTQIYTHLLAQPHTHIHTNRWSTGERFICGFAVQRPAHWGLAWRYISRCDLISCLLVWASAGVWGGRSASQEVTLTKSLKISSTWRHLALGLALISLTWRLKSTLKIKQSTCNHFGWPWFSQHLGKVSRHTWACSVLLPSDPPSRETEYRNTSSLPVYDNFLFDRSLFDYL